MIQVFSNSLNMEELDAVAAVMRSRWVGKGEQCAMFEMELEQYWNTTEGSVLLTNCCTSAIQIALRGLGISHGDEVIISTINFVACANAVLELNARPVFADVCSDTLNIDPDSLHSLITPRTKAVIVLHYGGHPCRMAEVLEVCGDIPVIEDAACAPSSLYEGKACGTLATAGVWSFDGMKILCMGDGGALWTQDDQLLGRARKLRYLGMDSESGTSKANKTSRWWEYEVDEPSGRFISNDILAAIGRQQLKKLPEFVARRREIWGIYQAELSRTPLLLPPEPDACCASSYYLYWVQDYKRDELASFLYGKGIYTTFRYFPLSYVKRFHHDPNRLLPGAQVAAGMTLCLPIHQNLKDSDVEFVVDKVKEFYS